MTALSIEGLYKSFGPVDVLRDISLEIAQGEFVSLLGPSGCGKTTTLRCIAGFELPSDGHIRFGNTEITWLPPERRDIGMVFQSYALFPHLTVQENLSFGLEMRKVPDADRSKRIQAVLEMVQLTGMEARFPRELSGGQQQRVALARALVIEPAVLLLDEPLANLDAALRDDMRFFIRELQQRVGITSVYVTHDQSEAIVMSDKIVVMFDGRIAQHGTPNDIYERPANVTVAGFIGRSNFVEGKVVSSAADGSHRLETAFGAISGHAARRFGHGTRATAMIRPENMTLAKARNDENQLKAKVASAVYLGNATNLSAHLSDGTALQLEAEPNTTLAKGDEIDIAFPPASTWIIEP